MCSSCMQRPTSQIPCKVVFSFLMSIVGDFDCHLCIQCLVLPFPMAESCVHLPHLNSLPVADRCLKSSKFAVQL